MNQNEQRALAREFTSVLSRLRRRIRAYVWVDGLALAGIWLGLTFWVGLAIDYLPVRLGASEMPVAARVCLLAVIAGVLAYILYRWIVRRTFVRLANSSLAVLLERRFTKFQDSLVTAVELRERSEHAADFRPDMLVRTDEQALSNLHEVRLGRVFNLLPLIRNLTLAVIVVLSLILFGVFATSAFATWFNRLYLLSEEPWPRRNHIEVLGFVDNTLKVAKGSHVTIRVRADATRTTPPPEVCAIYYRTEEGERGRVYMTKTGNVRGEHQYYSCSDKPFKGPLSSIYFDVVGGDHRVRDYEIQVVDSPSVVAVYLDCELPAYTGLVPRTEPWRPGIRLPKGTRITMRAEANKDLVDVTVFDPDVEETTRLALDDPIGPPRRRFTHEIVSLDRNTTFEITLTDTDGVTSQEPYRVSIEAREDEPPTVDVVLRGIGTAITPDARIPVEGEVVDDYGVDRTWFEVDIEDLGPREFPCRLSAGDRVDDSLDFRRERSAENDPLQLKEGMKVALTLSAVDRCDLDGGPNVAAGDRYALDVVPPSDLLALLEARELSLRRRFEQMIAEMRETRDSLARVEDSEANSAAAGSEPEDAVREDSADSESSPEEVLEDAERSEADRSDALRTLRVQRAIQHSQRAAQEVAGIAVAFDEIREELINNRVDTPERRDRLESQICAPLRRIADTMFPEWDEKLESLQSQLRTPSVGQAADQALEQADLILISMEAVLEKMLELETYNELIDVVRSLIREQEELIEQTKKEQKKRLLGL